MIVRESALLRVPCLSRSRGSTTMSTVSSFFNEPSLGKPQGSDMLVIGFSPETLDYLGPGSKQAVSDGATLLFAGTAADGRVRTAHAGKCGAHVIRAVTAALASGRDELVSSTACLPNAGQAAGHGKRP